MARTWNKIKNKINKYCSFAPEIQLKFLSADLRLNLSQCLDDMVPFRLYQMEKMVIRSEDASIMMNVVIPAKDKHTIFNRDLCDKYNYECKTEKISYYIYSLLEAICLQCGFFTWKEIRKYIIYFINVALTIFQYIEEKTFDELVTVQQEVHVLATLQIYQGLFNSFFMLIYSLLFVIYY